VQVVGLKCSYDP